MAQAMPGKYKGLSSNPSTAKQIHIVFENRTIKPVEIVLRWGDGRGGSMMEGNLIKVHCKHIWKCHNETPLYN
jgi:hypothetical protein